MAGVINVERLSITLSAGSQGQGTLTKGQDIANCVPFLTKRHTVMIAEEPDDWAYLATLVKFSATDKVDVTTNITTTREAVAEVTVVEFDPADVKVQQIDYAIGSAATSTTESITTVTSLTDAFVYHTYTSDHVAPPWDHNQYSAVRVKFNSTSQLGMDLNTAEANIAGTAYVVESETGDFSVEAVDGITDSGENDVDTTISSVTLAKAFFVSSQKTSSTEHNNDSFPAAYLETQTNVRLWREDQWTGETTMTGYVVEFDSGGAEKVQHGVLHQTTLVPSEDVNIESTNYGGTPDTAMIHVSGISSMKQSRGTNVNSADNPDASVAGTFVDADTIRLQHSTFGSMSGDTYDTPWEVIEWELNGGAPAARRVMVVS
jgi:hypothetical protein